MRLILKLIALLSLMFTSVNVIAQDFELKDSLYEPSKIQTKQLSPLTVKKLNQAQLMVEQGNTQQALNSLNRTLYQVKSPYEKAVIIQTAAHIILLKNDNDAYKQAIVLFKTVVDINSLTDTEQRNILLNIAILNGQLENYKQAVAWFQKWINEQEYAGLDVSSKKIMQLAQYYQLDERLKIAETYYQKAIKKALKNKEEVIESWYVQWLNVNFRLENFRKSETILKLLISMSPDNLKYYRQLAGIYEWQENSKQALSAWEMAYKQGLIQTKQDIQLLAQLLLRLNYPLKSASVLETFYGQDDVILTENDFELLASSYNAAFENQKAIESYTKAFEIVKNPKYALMIAQLHISKFDYDKALNMLLRVDSNKDGEYFLLLGYIYVQLEQINNAIETYQQALKFEKTYDQSKEWLDYLVIISENTTL